MKHLITRLLLYVAIAMVPVACGTRKASVSKSNTEQKDITKEESKGSVSTETKQGSGSNTTEQTAKIDEKQEQRITELFNENGSLKSRITELINSKSQDNSRREQSSWIYLHTFTDSTFNNTIYRDRTINIRTKDKDTSRTNNGWYWVVGCLGAVGLAFWLKPWVK